MQFHMLLTLLLLVAADVDRVIAAIGQYPTEGDLGAGDAFSEGMEGASRLQHTPELLYPTSDPSQVLTAHTVRRNKDYSTSSSNRGLNSDFNYSENVRHGGNSISNSDDEFGSSSGGSSGYSSENYASNSDSSSSNRNHINYSSSGNDGGGGSSSNAMRRGGFGSSNSGSRSNSNTRISSGFGSVGGGGYGNSRRRVGGGHRYRNTVHGGGGGGGSGGGLGGDPYFTPWHRSSNVEGERQRLESITLLLQRLGDRLMTMENAQTLRAERIDTINYRMTRLEAAGVEQKAALSELSSAVRHRLQTSDFELEKIRDALDELSSSMVGLAAQSTKIQAFLEAQQAAASAASTPSQDINTPRLRSVLAAVHGVRGLAQQTALGVEKIASNLTMLGDISSAVKRLTEMSVSKPFLRSSLAELRSQQQVLQPVLLQAAAASAAVRASRREPIDCYEVLERGKKSSRDTDSGIYLIQPQFASKPFFAYCDMTTDGGGWTVLQRRQEGTIDFLREWIDYKYGFGNLAGEFWLGNEKIHQLTNQLVNELRIEMADFRQEVAVARYSAFAIGSEVEGYALKLLGHYSGDAGDSLSYHVGQRWSTIDSDSDAWPDENCARNHKGAWWYRACDTSNLNGQYLHGPVPPDHEYQGIYWYDYRGPQYSLWRTNIMIRRGGFVSEPVIGDPGGVPSTATTTSAPPHLGTPDEEGAQTKEHPDRL